jgi:hypothetical protein
MDQDGQPGLQHGAVEGEPEHELEQVSSSNA